MRLVDGLATRTLERTSRYLGLHPVTSAADADFLLEVHMRNYGLDARSESGAYLFTNAEAVLLDRRTGRRLPGLANGTFVAPNGKASAVHGFAATHAGRSFTGARHTWPLDWELHATAPKLTESVTALLPDQLVRNTIVPTFWEGAVEAKGTHSGPCFVEISYR